MKKCIAITLTILFCLAMMTPITVSAAPASATLTGPASVQAGDTITLTLNVNGNGLYAVSGVLSYDADQVTLVGTKQAVTTPWLVEFNGNNFLAYDNELQDPIRNKKALFTVTFKVKNVAKGTVIKISYTDVTASDGNADVNIGAVTYQASVAELLSDNTPQKPTADGTSATEDYPTVDDNPTVSSTAQEPTISGTTLTNAPVNDATPQGGTAWWLPVIVILGLALGAIGIWFIGRSKK